ncbi:MAG: hypothetical protein AAFZ07_26440, partial [Actinomycetota bacterium]
LHRVQTLQATAGNRAVARAVAAAEPIGIQRNGPEPTDDEAVPAGARALIDEFGAGGLLVRSVQIKHAVKEFQNLTATVEEALALAADGNHSGLRKWTLANQALIANFYKMGPEVKAMARYMAVLAQPSRVGDRFVAFHEKDASSGNLQPGTQLVHQEAASDRISELMTTLKAAQAEVAGALENNEVQTLGFEPAAVSALLYKPAGDIASPKDWGAAKPTFQKVVNAAAQILAAGAPGEYHVFTYDIDVGAKTTSLRYLDTLVPEN